MRTKNEGKKKNPLKTPRVPAFGGPVSMACDPRPFEELASQRPVSTPAGCRPGQHRGSAETRQWARCARPRRASPSGQRRL